MKDYSRRGIPSTTLTVVAHKPEWQDVSGYRWLIVRVIVSQLDKKGDSLCKIRRNNLGMSEK